MHTLRALLCACIIGHALACFRITQNNPESLRYVEFDRVATDIKIQSDSNLIDCLGLENEMQKVRVLWNPSQLLPEYFNISIESEEKNFFARKTVPGNVNDVVFGVFVTPTRKYKISIEAEARLASTTTFVIERDRPCHQLDPYVWLAICIIFTILVFGLMLFSYYKHLESNYYEKDTTEKKLPITIDDTMLASIKR